MGWEADTTGILGQGYGRRQAVAIGDSITYGQHVKSEHRWTSVLQELVEDLQVINKGVCGDTTRGGLERFPQDVQNLAPRFVLIQFGFNDCNHWATDNGLPRVNLVSFKANLREMVDRAKRCRIGCQPFLVSMYPTGLGPEYSRWQLPYLNAIDTIRRDLWQGGSFNLFHNLEIDTVDGLHPSEAGHRVIAERVSKLFM